MKIAQNLLIFLIISLKYFCITSHAKPHCIPSACGVISNISSPFRLKNDPKSCGDSRFELVCENNIASIYVDSHRYHVKAINYLNHTIRLADAAMDNHTCSFPNYSLHARRFGDHRYPYLYYRGETTRPIHLISCPNPLKNYFGLITDITHACASSISSFYNGYVYVKVGRMNASDITEMCRVDLIVLTSWEFEDLKKNVSLSEIHQSLLYGFELNFCYWCKPLPTFNKFWALDGLIDFLWFLLILATIIALLVAVVSFPVTTIIGLGIISVLALALPSSRKIQTAIYLLGVTGLTIITLPKFIMCPLAVWFLIYKFRRRHLSTYEAIESFLQSDNKLFPIRYSYSHIKKMSLNFRDKLGEGGFGSVYKGKLRSGHHVAVKMLGKSGGNGQDFMNEIATIGRIHHVNVVRLVGYCAQGSKRALVYDFMPNGSLEKYLFNRVKMNPLNWDTKFEIVVGIARGIEYLHRGCDVQILHFDIKPHNILLDDNFVPKVSDFGLAKLCSIEKDTVTMTAARGTIGYVAPELISRSIGAVSYKADVYSFGMLLVEMVGLKRDLKGNNDISSKYFPYWIYDCFNQGKDIEIENDDADHENDSTRKIVRKMTIVALWCIKMSPDDRPSMNKVLEMLEGDVERLQIPDYPSMCSHIAVDVDESGSSCATDSSSQVNKNNACKIGVIVEGLAQLEMAL